MEFDKTRNMVLEYGLSILTTRTYAAPISRAVGNSLTNSQKEKKAMKYLDKKKRRKKRNLNLLEPVPQLPNILLVKDTFLAPKEKLPARFYSRASSFAARFSEATFEISTVSLEAFILTQAMTDSQIIAELGGEEAAETTLGDILES